MKLFKRILPLAICLLMIAGIFHISPTTAYAAGPPLTKTVSVISKLSGVHTASDFPITMPYDDGTYSGTLTRQNNTLSSIVRATPIVTYTYRSDTTYPTDKPAAGQYNFPATYSTTYYDPVSGQNYTVTLTKSGSPYFSGTAVIKYLYWTHYGYQYDPENHTKLGYMSNNTSTYYGGQYRFSDPPRQPSTYYGPSAEEGLGWVQYTAPVWDGALQDATKEPWKSLCLFWHGVERFVSDTSGSQNRYRKPVRLFYRRSASCKYIYQAYSGKASVTDTTITYTGTVTLKNAGPTISISHTPANPNAGDNVHISLHPADPDGGLLLLSATIQPMGEDNNTPGAVVTICNSYSVPSGSSYEYVLANAVKGYYRVTATVVDEGGLTASATSTIAVNQALPDLTVISANTTDWYAGMEVLVSARISNLSSQPVPSVNIRLTAGNLVVNEAIPVPGNGSNLAVFRFRVPNVAGALSITITADPGNLIQEASEYNNTWSKIQSVVSIPSTTFIDPDDPQIEEYHDALHKTVPALPNISSSSRHTWQEVRLQRGSYVVRDFWAELQTALAVSPDPRVVRPMFPDLLESGFGIQVHCTTTLTTNYDRPEKLIGTQMVWLYYPDTGYGMAQDWLNVHEAMDRNGQVTGGNTSISWTYPVNPSSIIGSRLHYTPLWFPDGLYTVLAQGFYAWSPVGQMFDYSTDSVIISGDMYDRIAVVRR